MAFVMVVNPEDLMVEMAVRNFEDSLRSAIRADHDYRSLEKEHPGLSEALIEAMSKAVRADTIADMPALRRRYARFYADYFSPSDTSELIRFYSSKPGQRLVTAKFAKIDAKPLAAELAESTEGQVSRQHIREINQATTQSIMSEMSVEDKAALVEFSKNPVFIKLMLARGPFEKLEADIANAPDPELDKALEAATNSVFLKFTGEPLPPDR